MESVKTLVNSFHSLCHLRPGIVVPKDNFVMFVKFLLLDKLVHSMQLENI